MKSLLNKLRNTQEVKIQSKKDNKDFSKKKEKERKQATGKVKEHLDQLEEHETREQTVIQAQ